MKLRYVQFFHCYSYRSFKHEDKLYKQRHPILLLWINYKIDISNKHTNCWHATYNYNKLNLYLTNAWIVDVSLPTNTCVLYLPNTCITNVVIMNITICSSWVTYTLVSTNQRWLHLQIQDWIKCRIKSNI